MITENLSTLKIHKLSQEQYNRELAEGNIEENALYLTPDTTYSAAGSSLGLVKSGGDVTISNGVITVDDDSHNHTYLNLKSVDENGNYQPYFTFDDTGVGYEESHREHYGYPNLCFSEPTMLINIYDGYGNGTAITDGTFKVINVELTGDVTGVGTIDVENGATISVETTVDDNDFSNATNLKNGTGTGSVMNIGALGAQGDYAHAEGLSTTAAGATAHAEGYGTHANGDYSHAEGLFTTASSNIQHVQGRYNVENADGTYAHIVGNGTPDGTSNAHTLDWDGNAWFAGDVYVGSTSGTNMDGSSKKLLKEGDGGVLIVSGISSDGVTYTATVDGISSLTAGQMIVFIPAYTSTSTAPTLNINSLGAKTIKRRLSGISSTTAAGYAANWLYSGKPQLLVYDGSYWIVVNQDKPQVGDLYGSSNLVQYADSVLSTLGGTSIDLGGGCQIATGSYTGTGAYGSSNPCSLTFDFVPKAFFVFEGGLMGVFSASTLDRPFAIWLDALTTSYTAIYSNGSSVSPANLYAKKSSAGTTVYWYSDHTVLSQQNNSSTVYYWLAIG